MKYTLYLLLALISTSVFAQNEEIRERLKDFKIDEDWLSSSTQEENAIHFYKQKQTTGSANGPVVSISEYDPRKPIGKRWTLLTVNDQPPTKQDIKKFNKLKNPKNRGANGKIEPNSYEIVRDDDMFFVVKFRLIKESLPSRLQFLGDCDGYVYCKKETGTVTYSEFLNFRPTQVKFFKVPQLHVEIYYRYDEESKTYVHEEEILDMKAMMMGVPQQVDLINELYDYKIVK